MDIILVDDSLINDTSKFAKDVFIDYFNNYIGNAQATYMANMFLSSKKIKELIDSGAIFKIVKENDKIIGFTEYLIDSDRVFLSKLYVHKDYRHKGIGKLMLNECIEYAKENNLNKIYLTVNKGNKPTIDVYNHIGFKTIDAVVNDIGQGYVMDDYIMELTLGEQEY